MANELDTFSNNLNTTLEAPEIDPQYLAIANEYLSGRSIPEISTLFAVSMDRVTSIIDRPDTKRYIDNVLMSQGFLHRQKRLDLINKVIDSKLEEALDSGVYSKKDLLEWIKLINEMEDKATPKGPKVAVQNNTTNNYAALMQDLLSPE